MGESREGEGRRREPDRMRTTKQSSDLAVYGNKAFFFCTECSGRQVDKQKNDLVNHEIDVVA